MLAASINPRTSLQSIQSIIETIVNAVITKSPSNNVVKAAASHRRALSVSDLPSEVRGGMFRVQG